MKTAKKNKKGKGNKPSHKDNLVTANQLVGIVLQALAPRMNKLETSIANKIESDAVNFRLLFDRAGIDSGMRQNALREMNIVREMLTLTNVICAQFQLDTPNGILMEFTNIGVRKDEHAPTEPIAIVFVWEAPGTEVDNIELVSATLCVTPDEGVKFDVGAVTPETGELAFFFITGEAFMLVSKGQSSTELEYMEHMVGIDMPAVVGNFIHALDLDTYFKELKKKAAEKNRHPEGAQMFGGKP
jgi:hypothetical protein